MPLHPGCPPAPRGLAPTPSRFLFNTVPGMEAGARGLGGKRCIGSLCEQLQTVASGMRCHTHAHTHTHTRTRTRTRSRTRARARTRTRTRTHTHAHTLTRTHAHTLTASNARNHTHIHTESHTHAHTHAQTDPNIQKRMSNNTHVGGSPQRAGRDNGASFRQYKSV